MLYCIMSFVVRHIRAKSALTKSRIRGMTYCLNPYTGCSHGCRYCYATFMKRFSGHREEWGTFVDAKINVPFLLQKQLSRTRKATVLVSSVTDPYQAIEKTLHLSRDCLQVLAAHDFPLTILTKSPLVLRDLDILKSVKDLEVGITITTDDERMRRLFEPGAPPINERIEALRKLSAAGIETYAFIGPILPSHPEKLADMIRPYVGSVLLDPMNYPSKTVSLYRKNGLSSWLETEFVADIESRLKQALEGKAHSV